MNSLKVVDPSLVKKVNDILTKGEKKGIESNATPTGGETWASVGRAIGGDVVPSGDVNMITSKTVQVDTSQKKIVDAVFGEEQNVDASKWKYKECAYKSTSNQT